MKTKKLPELRASTPSRRSPKSSHKAVRPQNRHLRPWRKGDPNIPKSPGRPRTAKMFAELGDYLNGHEDALHDYLCQRVVGKMRLHRIFDVLIKRQPALIFYWLFGKPQ